MPVRHTVLVVDDEADVVKSVKDLLRLDYRVLGATRAADGLEIMKAEEVHVVMSDQRMPGMTGVEFLHQIRGDYPEAIRLLFTGYADIRAVIDAINQGNVYRYITKPWDPEELQTIIREAVSRYELMVERNCLTAELQAKNQELQSANQRLTQANELKTAFIRVASHELRTPLTILVGSVRLALQTAAADAPSRPWLVRIDRAGQRLQYLIDQLVTMLSVGKFEKEVDRKPIDLAALIQQASDDVRPFIELRHQQLAMTLAPDLGEAAIDAFKIRDSINHLLLNAIKFTPDGGTITLSAGRTATEIELVVKDTGVGIDPVWLPRLFEPFFTGFDVSKHSSGTFEYGKQGLGLGLSVVKAFVEMHGGRIDVQSQRGEGTAFAIHLPVG